jgi:hypothetical protein
MAADGITAAAIDRCCTVNDYDHLAVIVVNCVAAFGGGGINGGH